MSPKCPNCASERIWRTHRKSATDHIRSWLGRYPYRCHECNTRFRLSREQAETESIPGKEKRKERTRLERNRRIRAVILFAVSLAIFALIAKYWILPETKPPSAG